MSCIKYTDSKDITLINKEETNALVITTVPTCSDYYIGPAGRLDVKRYTDTPEYFPNQHSLSNIRGATSVGH